MDPYLQYTARQLLKRRDKNPGVGFLRLLPWRHYLTRTLLIAVGVGIFYRLEHPCIAACAASIWAGRLLTDLQWYYRLSGEWETTAELIDWPKVERIAADRDWG
jgi:hypothetical protein